MRAARVVTAAAGILLLGWGAWLLLSGQDPAQLLSVAVWLAAVVVVHDGGLATASIIHRRLGVRRSPTPDEADERSR